ncbi:transcriptional regulator, LacI family [Spirochaeta thermophila DSM 6578]|uniref:Transcriptional regulator, LacI family n=1 Tax=Winmispira thermophila (strain ATCC 700085 / DSM 6578 / Z-1203) TaxID=869211 RepID=G0GAU8_WINT7|nr:LacI family DNA-binding transcriptional regulator [Spirochaeta thermophila]AEJ61844.1 transcriptional regulator, LacI family [Spirochaeta thermophila DSM 6578]
MARKGNQRGRKTQPDSVTIKDIAREANVSVTTVSNVIHGRYHRVSPATVEKVRSIIRKYNYTPNMFARSLVKQQSRIIGVINHLIPSQHGSFLQDLFHGTFVGGIERTLRGRDYFLMLRTVDDTRELYSLLKHWNMDGVIVVGLFKDEFFDLLLSSGTPLVLIDSYIEVESDRVFKVGLEDYKGGYLATKYLIQKGHTRIAFAGPEILDGGVVAERFRGYRDALEEAGLSFREEDVFIQDITVEEGKKLAYKLSRVGGITAVFATADSLAAGILLGTQDLGRRVPEDLSIVGFDDLPMSRFTHPPLTTIHQDVEEKGVMAANLLIDFLEGKPIPQREVVFSVRLVERSSVAERRS